MSEEIEKVIETTTETEETGAEPVIENESEEIKAASDPVVEEEPEGKPEGEKKNKLQQRFNQLTADKYHEKRRADDLAKELEKIKSATPSTLPVSSEEPTLEKYDYDEAKYQDARIEYEIDRRLTVRDSQQKKYEKEAAKTVAANEFSRKVESAAIEGYSEAIENLSKAVPLSEGVIEAIYQDDKGPELAYYLSQHLDVADKLSSKSSIAAALELGKISAGFSSKKLKTVSKASPPLKRTKGGGVVTKNLDNMSMEEIYALP